MRIASLLIAALAFSPVTRAADLPAAVFQTKPLGQILADVKAGMKMVGGDARVKQFDDELKDMVGDKGITGIDLHRPIQGYLLPEYQDTPDKHPYVLILPITSEAEFVEFLGRKTKVAPVPGQKGLYRATSSNSVFQLKPTPDGPKVEPAPAGTKAGPEHTTLFRVQGKYAFAGMDAPDKVLDDAALAAPDKLEMTGETAMLTMRVYFDRLSADVRKKTADSVEKGLESLKNMPVPPDAEQAVKRIAELGQQAAARYLSQVKEADQAVFRVQFDPISGEGAIEGALKAKPGTSLAKDIAARGASTNRFAGMIGRETAFATTFSFPLFTDELRQILAIALEEGEKKAAEAAPEPFRPVASELLKGLGRTIRAGGIDSIVVANSLEKDGKYSMVLALSFEDSANLEKELRTLFKAMAPPQMQKAVKLDAAKAGPVSIHLIDVEAIAPPDSLKNLGPNPKAALAFGPHGIYVVVGNDPVASMKTALAAEPGKARAFDIIVNPARTAKLVKSLGNADDAKRMEEQLGNVDSLLSAFFVSLDGGDELRVQFGINLRMASKSAAAATQKLPVGGSPPPSPK